MAKRDENDSGSHFRDKNVKRSRTAISKGDLNFKVLPSYFTRKRGEDIMKDLEMIPLDAELGKTIHWSKLLPALCEVRINERTASDCFIFMMELLRLFERYRCKDTNVIYEVFHVLQLLTGGYNRFVKDSTKSENFFCIPYGENKSKTDFVSDSVTSANLGLLKLQLKFGMLLTTPSSYDCCIIIHLLITEWFNVYADDITEDENIIDNDTPMEELQEDQEGLMLIVKQETLNRNFNAKSIKRLSLVFKVLNIVFQMKRFDKDRKEHFTECYRLIFNFLPEPYLTSNEVKGTLEKCLSPPYSRLIGTITENFKNLLPELAEVSQPRSLQHLCRIQVRQCLRQNLNLHTGVSSSLQLPKILKEYITLNDDGDYSVTASLISTVRAQWENPYCIKPELYVNIPGTYDCATSFIRDLLSDC